MTATLDQLWAAGLLDASADPRAAAAGALWLAPSAPIELGDANPEEARRQQASQRTEADADFVLSTSALFR